MEISRRMHRVSMRQIELLWEFLIENKDVATGFNRSLQAKEYSKKKWREIAAVLNSEGDGAHKDWKGWSKYWVDYKAKLKSKVAAIRSSHARTGGGPPEKDLTDIEKKFLQILGEDFGQGMPGVQVDPFPEPLESDAIVMEYQDSPASQSILDPVYFPFDSTPPVVQGSSMALDSSPAQPCRRNLSPLPHTSSTLHTSASRTATLHTPGLHTSFALHTPATHTVTLHTPAPHTSTRIHTSAPHTSTTLHTPAPHTSSTLHTPAPHTSTALHTPAPHTMTHHTPVPHTSTLHTHHTPPHSPEPRRRRSRREPYMSMEAARRAVVQAVEQHSNALETVAQAAVRIERILRDAFPRASERENDE